MTFVVVLAGWVFSLCLHEFMHAFVAYQGGDYTVKDKGYLTFNPLKYTHPVYSLLMPILFLLAGGIGLPGGAVYIERWRLRGPRWETAVSLAGPLSNAVLALTLGLILRFTPVANSIFGPGLAFLAWLQVSAVVLNLLPVPPFDGFGAIEPHLPYEWRVKLADAGRVCHPRLPGVVVRAFRQPRILVAGQLAGPPGRHSARRGQPGVQSILILAVDEVRPASKVGVLSNLQRVRGD